MDFLKRMDEIAGKWGARFHNCLSQGKKERLTASEAREFESFIFNICSLEIIMQVVFTILYHSVHPLGAVLTTTCLIGRVVCEKALFSGWRGKAEKIAAWGVETTFENEMEASVYTPIRFGSVRLLYITPTMKGLYADAKQLWNQPRHA